MASAKVCIAVVIAAIVIIGTVAVFLSNVNRIGSYDAMLKYTTLDITQGPMGIRDVGIGEFKKADMLSVMTPKLEFGAFEPVRENITITCRTEKPNVYASVYNHQDGFRTMEGSFVDRTVTIHNLPPEGICRAYIDLECYKCSDQIEYTIRDFVVPAW